MVNVKNIAKETPLVHASCMLRTSAYRAINGYSESPRYIRVEDYDLWIRMFSTGAKGYSLEDVLYMINDSRTSASRKLFKYRINEARVKCDAIKKFKLGWNNYVFAIRPLVIGIIPAPL